MSTTESKESRNSKLKPIPITVTTNKTQLNQTQKLSVMKFCIFRFCFSFVFPTNHKNKTEEIEEGNLPIQSGRSEPAARDSEYLLPESRQTTNFDQRLCESV